MPIDNGVGLLAQVLMNQQAGRQRAAAQTAQMQQQQDLTDQGQEFHQQSLAQQLQAQARAQAIHAQMAAQAQAAQDQRAEAADTRRAGREDARDQNRATREDNNATKRQGWEEAQKALDRAQQLEIAKMGKNSTSHIFQHADPNKPAPSARPVNPHNDEEWMALQNAQGDLASLRKRDGDNFMLGGEPSAEQKIVAERVRRMQAQWAKRSAAAQVFDDPAAGAAPPPQATPPQVGKTRVVL